MTWPLATTRSLLVAGALSTLFGLSYFAAARFPVRASHAKLVAHRSGATWRQERSGLLVVYLTSSECSAAHDKELPALLASKLRRVEAAGARWGLGVASVAIAMDDNPGFGARELTRYSNFQELASGAGHANLLYQEFFRGENAGNDATPGVVIAEWVGEEYGLGDSREARIVRRLIGLQEIKRWARDTTDADIVPLAERARLPDSALTQSLRR